MNETEIEATEVFADHSLYATLIGVEKARMYKMGFQNAGHRVYEIAEALDFVIVAGSYALPDLAVNGKDFDLTFELARSIYFASVKLVAIANEMGKPDNIRRATHLHAVVVNQLKKADLICPGFSSYPAWRAKKDWLDYTTEKHLRSLFAPELYAEQNDCCYSYSTAQELFAQNAVLGEYANEQELCDDYHDNQCWYCSYDT